MFSSLGIQFGYAIKHASLCFLIKLLSYYQTTKIYEKNIRVRANILIPTLVIDFRKRLLINRNLTRAKPGLVSQAIYKLQNVI